MRQPLFARLLVTAPRWRRVVSFDFAGVVPLIVFFFDRLEERLTLIGVLNDFIKNVAHRVKLGSLGLASLL